MEKLNYETSDFIKKQDHVDKPLENDFLSDSQIPENEFIHIINELQLKQKELEYQNEQILQQNEQIKKTADKYYNLYEFASTANFTLSRKGRILELNHSASMLLGKENENLIEIDFDTFVVNESKPNFTLFLEKVFNAMDKQSCKVELIKDSSITLQTYITAISDQNKEICYITVQEIEQEKENDLLSSFLKYSPVYTYIKEVKPTESKVLFASENFIDMIGVAGSEMIGKTMNELFPADFAAKVTTDDWSVASGDKAIKYDEFFNGRNYITIKQPILHDGKTLLAGYTIDITDRKKIEDEYHKSREQFHLAMEATKDGYFDWDLIKDYIYFSPACYHILGYEDHEIEDLKLEFNSFVHTEDIEKVNAIIEESIENNLEDRFSVEYRIKTKAGNWKWILSRSFVVTRDNNGKALRIIGTHADISKRKKAEEIQKKNEEQISRQNEMFQMLLKNIQIGIFMVEAPSGKALIANDKAMEILGRGILPDTSMQNLAEVYKAYRISNREPYPPEEMPILRGINGESSYIDDLMVVKPDGTEVYLEIFGSPVKDIYGNVWASIVSFEDITKRKKAEQALIESEMHFRELAESITEVFFEMDKDLRYTYWNKATEILNGISSKEAIGKSIYDFFSETPELKKAVSFYKEVLANRQPRIFEYTFNVNNNSIIFEMRVFPTQKGIAVFSANITDRKNNEMALIKSNNRFNELTELAVDGILIGSKDGFIIDANSCICEMTGRSKDEIIGKHISNSFFTVESIERIPFQFDLLNKGELVINERNIMRPDGIEITIEMRTKKMSNGEYQSFFRDVSERKKIETALKSTNVQLEERVSERSLQLIKSYLNVEKISKNYETFFNTIDEMLFVSDLDGNIIHANKTAENQLGYMNSEICGKSFLTFYSENYHETLNNFYLKAHHSNLGFNHIPMITKMGYQFLVDSKVFKGEWDNKPAFFGIFTNITKISFSEMKFSTLFNLNPVACGLSDLNIKQYIEVNESFCNLFGYSKSEVIGRTILELGIMKADVRESILIKADSNGRLINVKTSLRTKNGDIRHVLLSADNISLPDNKYRFTVCQDVTEQTIVEAIQTQQLNFSNAYNKIAEVIISNNTSSDILKTTNSIIRNVLKIDNSLICNVSFENNKIQYLSDSFKKDYQDFISLFEENFSFESFKKSLAEIRNNQHWIESHVNKRNDYFQHEGSSDIIHIISGIKSLLWYPFAFYKDGYYLLILNQIAKQRIFSNTELVFIKSIVKLVNLALLKIKLLDKIKLNEISLFEKEYNLRDSQQISQIGCWEYDNSNHIMRWSDETFRVLGYKPQRFKPTLELFFNSIHKDDLELVEKSIHKSWNSNESLVIDIRIVIDGRIKIMKLHAEIIYDGILKSYKWVGTIQDITEKKKTEELLKNTIIHLRQLRLYNEKVREDERLNISRELHDDLGQALTAVNIEIGLINTKTSDSVLNDKIKTISNLVDDTIGKVQKLTMQLRPVMIDDLGLASAMEWYIAEFEQRNKITVLQQLDTEIEVSSDIAIHIFRITQESLTNIARHAKASQVIIWLNKTDDFIFLRITDNGIGITDNQIRSKKSFGIISMKERMISLGGCFDIYGYETGGSVINIFLPLH